VTSHQDRPNATDEAGQVDRADRAGGPARSIPADTVAADLAPDRRLRADGGEAEVVPLRGHRGVVARRAQRGRPGAVDRPDGRPSPPPDPARLAVLLVRLTAEVAAGRRPVAQLEPLLAPTLLRRLAAQLRPGIERPQEPPHVRRVVVAPPTPTGAVETTVLLEAGGRITALAVRLERHRGLWRATELTAPESGYRALPTRSDPLQRRGSDAFDEAAEEERTAEALVTRRRGTA
jgi:hypothetical protein